MKLKLTSTLMLIALVAPSVLLAADPMDDMKKELRVFTRILRTTFQDGEDDHWGRRGHHENEGFQPDDIAATYLKGQGVVLSMELDGAHRHHGFFPGNNFTYRFERDFRFDNQSLMDLSFRLEEFNTGQDLDEDEQEELEEAMEEAAEEVEEMAEEMAEEMQDMAEEIAEQVVEMESLYADQDRRRELSERIRELRGQQRELSRSARERTREATRSLRGGQRLNDEQRKQIETELAAVQEEIRAKMQANIAEVETLRQESLAKWTQRYDEFEVKMMDVLCEFGASVRSLPNDEHFTLIIKDAEVGEGDSRDKIYVFKKSDLIACRDGRMSKADLKAASQVYSF